ncbi:hypothetical protein [Aliivibrio fischeri]|uniref:hypothetical protein n=1 Tax=Aliivibrio fischeri TaxID=668 RepID=UPI0007C57F9B|nr:hypothetical protein [Aliivibrio fischeri]
MQIYNSSGIRGFELNSTSITVWFGETARSVSYDYDSAGKQHIDRMKIIAVSGGDLNSYIDTHVKFRYVRD